MVTRRVVVRGGVAVALSAVGGRRIAAAPGAEGILSFHSTDGPGSAVVAVAVGPDGRVLVAPLVRDADGRTTEAEPTTLGSTATAAELIGLLRELGA